MLTNNFSLKIATPNGTGSSSANSLLVQAIFRMGVPISGKNIFPSNIQGLPTWYEIRVDSDGHLGRCPDCQLVVALNGASYDDDVASVATGGCLLYDSSWPREGERRRADINYLGVPFARLVNDNFPEARQRILMKNICYVGVLTALCAIDRAIVDNLLREKFADKQFVANGKAIELGYRYASENFSCPLPYAVSEPVDCLTTGKMLIDGNSATALACIYAGATVAAWYPITPSTSLLDAFQTFCRRWRQTDDGNRGYCVVQAEDEMAALAIVLGATWGGARAFTSTSGPGISLMTELLGFAYYAELPAVIFNVQRVGPSTGMPTRTQQSDLLSCAYASHGDTKQVLIFPANPAECFQLTIKAFDLADLLQTPVIVMTDLDIAMNDWLSDELTWDDEYRPQRGKIVDSGEQLSRYLDSDGDGICYRSLPGQGPAFFTRGSGHNSYGQYTERGDEYRQVLDRLVRKHETAKDHLPPPEIVCHGQHDVALVTIGSCWQAVSEALAVLARQGVVLDCLRITAFPFVISIDEFLADHRLNIVIEQNRDRQLRSLLTLETGVSKDQLASVLNYDGQPMTALFVVDAVQQLL